MPATARTLRTNDGSVTVETPYSDSEMIDILRSSAKNFAKSLLTKHVSGGLSSNQIVWGHRLALEEKSGSASSYFGGGHVAGLKPIVDLFETAVKTVSYPKIVFAFEDLPIAVSRNGNRSKHPGSLSITDGKKFGDAKYYGRIDLAGTFMPWKECPDSVPAFLKMFAANPGGVAADFGREQKNCCFCQLPLTDERSLAVGYGKACSKTWGNLPWGAKAVAEEIEEIPF